MSPTASLETADCKPFLGLQLDDDLLRDEFDAIIAAEYPVPRPPRTTTPMRLSRRARSPLQQSVPGTVRVIAATPVADADGPGRERSPPDPPSK